MSKNYNTRKIKSQRSYSVTEVANILNVSRGTVLLWIKEGLQVLGRPYLIMGEEIKAFLSKRRAKHQVSLKYHEYYCLRCRKAVSAKKGSEKIVPTGKRIGKENQEQFKRVGLCENCRGEVMRFLRGGDRGDYKIPSHTVQTRFL